MIEIDEKGATFEGHHIFCNYARFRPVEECSQCKSLFETCDFKGRTLDEFMSEEFPDVIIRK